VPPDRALHVAGKRRAPKEDAAHALMTAVGEYRLLVHQFRLLLKETDHILDGGNAINHRIFSGVRHRPSCSVPNSKGNLIQIRAGDSQDISEVVRGPNWHACLPRKFFVNGPDDPDVVSSRRQCPGKGTKRLPLRVSRRCLRRRRLSTANAEPSTKIPPNPQRTGIFAATLHRIPAHKAANKIQASIGVFFPAGAADIAREGASILVPLIRACPLAALTQPVIVTAVRSASTGHQLENRPAFDQYVQATAHRSRGRVDAYRPVVIIATLLQQPSDSPA
jgi:hypothetical protein